MVLSVPPSQLLPCPPTCQTSLLSESCMAGGIYIQSRYTNHIRLVIALAYHRNGCLNGPRGKLQPKLLPLLRHDLGQYVESFASPPFASGGLSFQVTRSLAALLLEAKFS